MRDTLLLTKVCESHFDPAGWSAQMCWYEMTWLAVVAIGVWYSMAALGAVVIVGAVFRSLRGT
jgi:hypothetical protein